MSYITDPIRNHFALYNHNKDVILIPTDSGPVSVHKDKESSKLIETQHKTDQAAKSLFMNLSSSHYFSHLIVADYRGNIDIQYRREIVYDGPFENFLFCLPPTPQVEIANLLKD